MFKKFYTLLFVYSCFANAYAQDKSSGIIYFDQVINMKATTVQAGGNASFAIGGGNVTLPETVTNRFEILFSPAGAKFQKAAVDESASGGFSIRMNTRDVFFKDDKAIESFELDGEALMLENKLGHLSDKIEKSDQTIKIIGFTCKKAVITGANDAKTTIWYTTELPLKISPMVPFWVEGAVLGIENDRMKFVATNIDYTKVKDSEFELPKKAKLLTQEEYTKKMEAFRSKLGNGVSVGPNGERRVIRMN